jgi:uncharacterized phosphosugar-binding protein
MPASTEPLARVAVSDDGVAAYLKTILALQQRVVESQQEKLKRIAQQMAKTVLDKKRIFVFGTGHSHMLAEEAFCRAGGLAAVVPIFHSGLMLHESIPVEALLERTPGIATPLLDRMKPQAGEMIFIFSNSGVNHVPVEMAQSAKDRGLFVVTFCSFKFAATAPLSPIGRRLADLPMSRSTTVACRAMR